MSQDGSNERVGEADEAFHERLRELKEEGCAVLVVGSVPSGVCADACDRLLGEAETLPRHRLFVFTNGKGGMEDRLRAYGGSPGSTEATAAAVTRSAAAAPPMNVDVPVTELAPDSLAELGTAISESIDTIEARHGPLEAAELRLCMDSLLPLLEEHGDQPVFEFLLLTAARVRAADGIGHFHLPVERGDRVARLLASAVDAVLELRMRDGDPQQQWFLDQGELKSGWLPL